MIISTIVLVLAMLSRTGTVNWIGVSMHGKLLAAIHALHNRNIVGSTEDSKFGGLRVFSAPILRLRVSSLVSVTIYFSTCDLTSFGWQFSYIYQLSSKAVMAAMDPPMNTNGASNVGPFSIFGQGHLAYG